MKKIGRRLSFFAVLVIQMLMLQSAWAQQVEVTAELTETNIYRGESVQVKVTISGRSIDSVEEPVLPEVQGLRWLQGSTSRGSSYSLINGQPSVSYTYGFNFIAQETGSYTLQPIEVEVNGTVYKTQPISYKVLNPENIDEAERSPDIYLRLETDAESPVVGQQVIADVVIYFKNGIEVSSYQSTPGWKAEGFWKEELQNPQRAQTTSTIINGIRYQRARLLQYALFPTKAGELTLSPFEITVAVRQQRNARDPFGFGLGRERMSLQSLPVTMDVRALPEISNAQFTGAVGKFNISREVNPVKALVGESIEIKTTISGTGNIPLINKPEYMFPESMEKYNPQESSEIYRTNRIISGYKTYTDILIARNDGVFTIPAKDVAYFNPSENRYQIITLPAINIEVERDPNATISTPDQLRLNVKPITGLASWTTVSYQPLHTRPEVWALLLLPFLITGLLYIYKQYSNRLNSDTAFARSQKAKQKAMSLLNEAQKADTVKEGYHLIEKALYQYVADKFNLPPAGLSSAEITEAVRSNCDRETVNELQRLLQKCETIAYAPNTTPERLQTDIDKTRNLIKAIGKSV